MEEKVTIDRELLAECFALLGIAKIEDEELSQKREETRNKILIALHPKRCGHLS